jgi:hypothetical protein
MPHEQEVQNICDYALKVLDVSGLKFKPMKRKNCAINTKRSFVIGRTNLKTGIITIDILTPRQRQPKKISSILRTLCHEVAHHQKPPFKQLYKFRQINRQHYPLFYKQVKKNITKLKKDKNLAKYF